MSDQAVTWKDEAHRKRDLRQRKIGELKSRARMFFHGVWWKTLWFLHLGKPYSRFMCRMGWYRKFPDGRCQYCGMSSYKP